MTLHQDRHMLCDGSTPQKFHNEGCDATTKVVEKDECSMNQAGHLNKLSRSYLQCLQVKKLRMLWSQCFRLCCFY